MHTTNMVLMISPAGFMHNSETAGSNSFQHLLKLTNVQIRVAALAEFTNMIHLLQEHDIEILVFDDISLPQIPDAVFPNNWFSTHTDGTIITYPMYAPNRRAEKDKTLPMYSLQIIMLSESWISPISSHLISSWKELVPWFLTISTRLFTPAYQNVLTALP
jgi:hypothetical protein